MAEIILLKQYKTNVIGKQCMRSACHKSARQTYTIKLDNGMKIPSRACLDHARKKGPIT